MVAFPVYRKVGTRLTKKLSALLLSLSLATPSAHSATASWYGKPFHGRITASGERYNMHALTTASNTHKMGTKLKVTNKSNGKSVVVRVNDTGGFKKYGRTLDLSKAAFSRIADIEQGLAKVSIQVLKQ